MYKSYYLYIPAIVFWLLWILWKYLFSTKNNSNKQIFLNSLLYAYLVFVFGLTLFPIPTTAPQTESIISFTPLEIILPMFSLDSAPIAQYILSSVVLFIPLWFANTTLYAKSQTFKNNTSYNPTRSFNRNNSISYRSKPLKYNVYQCLYWWYFA